MNRRQKLKTGKNQECSYILHILVFAEYLFQQKQRNEKRKNISNSKGYMEKEATDKNRYANKNRTKQNK